MIMMHAGRQPAGRVDVVSDVKLAAHALEIEKALSPDALKELTTKYPDIKTIRVEKGRSFNVQGFDPQSKTLRLLVNPSSPKTTGQQFAKKFRPRRQVGKEKPADTSLPEPIRTDAHGLMVFPAQIDSTHPEDALSKLIGGTEPGLGKIPEVLLPGKTRPLVSATELTALGLGPDELDDLVKQKPNPPAKRTYKWPDIAVDEEASREIAYRPGARVPSRNKLRELMENYYVGNFVDVDGKVRFTVLGKPLDVLEEVNLFRVKVDSVTVQHLFDIPFNFDSESRTVVVPIVGDFYGRDGPITGELEARGLIERVRDDDENPVTTPIPVKGARQLLIPFAGEDITVGFIKVGDRKFIPNSPEAVYEIWDSIEPGAVEYVFGFTEKVLEDEYEKTGKTQSFDEFREKEFNRYFMNVGVHMIRECIRLQREGVGVEVDLSNVEVVKKPVCAFGVKGSGCDKYDGNYIEMDADGNYEIPAGFRFKQTKEKNVYIVNERLENSKGIMLSIPHQEWIGNPVGGDSVENLLAFDRENRLLKHGAMLSYITTAVIPLLSKDDVPDLSTDRIALVYNAVIDDTRRIEMFLNEDVSVEGNMEAYRDTIPYKYATSRGVPSFKEARDTHWRIMCANIGRNLNAMYDAGLNNPGDRNLIGNFSLDGGLCDTIDLARLRESREFHSSIFQTLQPLEDFYKIAGFENSFFESEYFTVLMKEMIGKQEAKQLTAKTTALFRSDSIKHKEIKVGKAIGLATDAFLKAKGVEEESVWDMSEHAFIRLLEEDDGLRGKIGLEKVPSGGMRKERMEFYRAKADIELRCNSAMTIREMVVERREEYRRKYAA